MDITKDNFDKQFETIKNLLTDCDFISFDTELTGLTEVKTSYHDTPEIRYKKLVKYAMNYAITQFGICIFKFNKEESRFESYPINFNIFPDNNCNFSMNSQTIQFLNKHNFDYNKSFKNSIKYSSTSNLTKSIEEAETQFKSRTDEIKCLDVNKWDFTEFREYTDKIDVFLADDKAAGLEFDKPNETYENYVIKHVLWKKYANQNQRIFMTEDNYKIRVNKTSENPEIEIENHERKKKEEKLKKIQNLKRFNELIEIIFSGDYYLVGHNCLLDVIHIFHKFYGNLPESFSEFCLYLSKKSLKFYDTKYISTYSSDSKMFPKGCLEKLYSSLLDQKNIIKPTPNVFKLDDYKFDENSNDYHTAHYDAYITGRCFITMIDTRYAVTWSNMKLSRLASYENKLAIVFCVEDFLSLNPHYQINKVYDRSNIFYLTVPSNWCNRFIVNFMTKSLKISEQDFLRNNNIRWETSTCAQIKSKLPLKEAKIDEISGVKLESFEEYHEELYIKSNGVNEMKIKNISRQTPEEHDGSTWTMVKRNRRHK